VTAAIVAESAERRRWGTPDVALFVSVVFAAGAWCWWFGWRGSLPYEDATMLFRYVDNVAAGHGVVWNVGEAPVDGATDLGFMFVLAGLRSAGIDAQLGALIINSLAFVGIAGGLFAFARHRRISPILATLLAALFVVSSGVTLIHAGFGAVFFSAAVALAAIAMFNLTDESTRRNAALLACAGVVAGLIRPEGFLIGGAFIATALAVVGRPLLRMAMLSCGLLVAAGLGFVIARWAYFGFPLPNPYYKKGDGTLHLDGLVKSVAFATTVGAVPILMLVVIGLVAGVNRRWLAYLGCTGALLGMWLLVSSEMDFNYRFQFPIVVVVLLMVIDLGSREMPSLVRRVAPLPSWVKRAVPVLVALVLVVHVVVTQQRLGVPETASRPQQAIAKVLAESGRHDLRVATTEAGAICWKSGWKCTDLWGLNDVHIAHEGYLDGPALARLNPDVIVVHAPTSPVAASISAAEAASSGDWVDGWVAMTDPLIRFAEGGKYVLAAMVSPKVDSGFAVYVRSGEAWSAPLISAFGAIEPTMRSFYGPSIGSRPTLPTAG
jgi:arabinofuranosyltransferase